MEGTVHEVIPTIKITDGVNSLRPLNGKIHLVQVTYRSGMFVYARVLYTVLDHSMNHHHSMGQRRF
jgi:hypothetical protein